MVALKDAAILWDSDTIHGKPTSGGRDPRVAVVEIGDPIYEWERRNGRTLYSGGACWMAWRSAEPNQALRWIHSVFYDLVINYGIPPKMVDEAFMAIDEWRVHGRPDSCLDWSYEGACRDD